MTNRSNVKRVLIYRLGSLGDTVVALPSLHLVARTFPSARRVLLTNLPVHSKAPAAWSVLEDSGLIDSCFGYPVGTRSITELAKVWRQVRAFRPQVMVYLVAERSPWSILRDKAFFRACGISEFIGLPVGELAAPRYSADSGLWEHESSRLLRTIGELGEADIADKRNWDLRLTSQEIQVADSALAELRGPYVVCGPGTKMQAKDWGAENWRQLLQKLNQALPGHALVLVGAKEDWLVGERVASGWHGTVVNLCGRLTPRQTAAALRHADLFLGPDSGPMHLASAMGVACASVFAARAKPGAWYPIGDEHRVVYHRVECMECGLETCIRQKKKCLTSVSVDEMLAAALDAWKAGKEKRAKTSA